MCKGHALNMAGGNATVAGTAVLAQTGTMNLAIGFPLELVAEFPEVETIASFATTLLGWGVQGEIAWREEIASLTDSNWLRLLALSAVAPSPTMVPVVMQ